MYFEFNNVSYTYHEIQALDNLSFSGEKGQIIGLIGENGAGKSTTIKNIVRYLIPDSGTICLDGKNVFKIKSGKYPVSYIPDTPVFYEELSLLEHLQFTQTVYPGNTLCIDKILDRMELRDHVNKIPAALSKGTRQKLMIAMALLREYEILIADEPFSGLDPKQISLLKQAILQQKEQNKLVLLSSHLLDVIENICDKYVVIRQGKLLAEGTKSELLSLTKLPADSTMENVYLRLVKQDG